MDEGKVGDTAQFHRDRSSCTQDPSGPCPMCLSIWLFTCILYNTLYNKLVNVSLRSKLIKPKEGAVGTSDI